MWEVIVWLAQVVIILALVLAALWLLLGIAWFPVTFLDALVTYPERQKERERIKREREEGI